MALYGPTESAARYLIPTVNQPVSLQVSSWPRVSFAITTVSIVTLILVFFWFTVTSSMHQKRCSAGLLNNNIIASIAYYDSLDLKPNWFSCKTEVGWWCPSCPTPSWAAAKTSHRSQAHHCCLWHLMCWVLSLPPGPWPCWDWRPCALQCTWGTIRAIHGQ